MATYLCIVHKADIQRRPGHLPISLLSFQIILLYPRCNGKLSGGRVLAVLMRCPPRAQGGGEPPANTEAVGYPPPNPHPHPHPNFLPGFSYSV
jgi:hypothetical protein